MIACRIQQHHHARFRLQHGVVRQPCRLQRQTGGALVRVRAQAEKLPQQPFDCCTIAPVQQAPN
jgi:hypothetical protein